MFKFQFTVRALLVVVTLACGVAGWYRWQEMVERQRLIEELKEIGAIVECDGQGCVTQIMFASLVTLSASIFSA